MEEVDIFPSLVDLGGFTVPSDLMGESWVPLLRKTHEHKLEDNEVSMPSASLCHVNNLVLRGTNTMPNTMPSLHISPKGVDELIQGGKETVFSQYPHFSEVMVTHTYTQTKMYALMCE